MSDIHTKNIRSYNMSQVKDKNTKTELIVRKYLFAHGLRYRIHNKKLLGKPDIVLPKHKTIIFVNGCFWHGHDACSYAALPKTRTKWWEEKINKNKAKDAQTIKVLQEKGWRILTIWGCDLKSKNKDLTLSKLLSKFKIA